MYYSFDDYWKKIGKFNHEVIILDNKVSEQELYNLCEKVWWDAYGTDEETYSNGHIDGYECCEQENGLMRKEDK